MNMWGMWWRDIITQQQEKHDVIIQFNHNIMDSSKHRSSIIQVSFEIIGTDIDALKCIESTLCDEETEERVIHNTLKVNKSAFLEVTKLSVFSTFPIAISDVNQWSDTVTVVSPKSLSSNLDIAEDKIFKFFELHADMSKEISFKDPIFHLILLSPEILNNYTETIKEIAEREKVEVGC